MINSYLVIFYQRKKKKTKNKKNKKKQKQKQKKQKKQNQKCKYLSFWMKFFSFRSLKKVVVLFL